MLGIYSTSTTSRLGFGSVTEPRTDHCATGHMAVFQKSEVFQRSKAISSIKSKVNTFVRNMVGQRQRVNLPLPTASLVSWDNDGRCEQVCAGGEVRWGDKQVYRRRQPPLSHYHKHTDNRCSFRQVGISAGRISFILLIYFQLVQAPQLACQCITRGYCIIVFTTVKFILFYLSCCT